MIIQKLMTNLRIDTVHGLNAGLNDILTKNQFSMYTSKKTFYKILQYLLNGWSDKCKLTNDCKQFCKIKGLYN